MNQNLIESRAFKKPDKQTNLYSNQNQNLIESGNQNKHYNWNESELNQNLIELGACE